MHVGMAVVAFLFLCNAMVRQDIFSVILGLFAVPGLLISAHIVYKMRDTHLVHHRSRVYRHGPGTEIRVRYSRYVPMNYCVELYADDCHVASLYRGNEDAISIPPDVGRIAFMLGNTCIGEFSPVQDGCFYIYSENRIPLDLTPSIRLSDSFEGIDPGSEERAYNVACEDLRKESKANLFWSWMYLI